MEDVTLLSRIAEDNAEAFEALYLRYYQRFYAIALKMTRAPCHAEEIVQEVFTNIWIKRAQLHGLKNPSSYLTAIARHSVCAYFKRNALDEKMKIQLMFHVHTLAAPVEEALLKKERACWLETMVARLPYQQRRIFSLVTKEGLSRKEVACQLGISAHTVRNHLWAAMKVIRAQYGKHVMRDDGPLQIFHEN